MDSVSNAHLQDRPLARRKSSANAESNAWSWRDVGACLGLAGGIACSLLGSVLIAVSWLMGAGGASLYAHRTGTALLLLTIPLIVVGAQCLDLRERHQAREKRARFDEER